MSNKQLLLLALLCAAILVISLLVVATKWRKSLVSSHYPTTAPKSVAELWRKK